MDSLTLERWPDADLEDMAPRRTSPPPVGDVVNRWGDTRADQKRRRRELVDAMREQR